MAGRFIAGIGTGIETVRLGLNQHAHRERILIFCSQLSLCIKQNYLKRIEEVVYSVPSHCSWV